MKCALCGRKQYVVRRKEKEIAKIFGFVDERLRSLRIEPSNIQMNNGNMLVTSETDGLTYIVSVREFKIM